ncbi:putative uncharacterized protein [Eubacterium sp. CAG:603]|jgi:flagellar hook-associated protein 1 FlgK|nr:putative uncharacterized protein [Eubacterium sp. CAG:603]
MASTFFGLNIATSGISAAQAGLSTTMHNVANENTKGYSRQQVSQSAANAIRFYTSYGMLGAGVEVSKISQVRDSYYDDKYRYNQAKVGEYTSKDTYALQIEDYFNEFETDGFIVEYENLFDTLKSMQGNPSELTYRNEFLSSCQTIAEYFNDIQTKLTNLQQETNTEVSNLVDRINTISSQVASLTKQINTVELTGAVANDLRDKRELLLDELSEIIPIEVTESIGKNGNSEFDVKVQGVTLVDTYDSMQLYTVERENPKNSMDSPGLYDIYFQGTKLDVQAMGLSGSLRAALDVRDGNNGTIEEGNPDCEAIKYKGIPHYVNKIQVFKKTITNLFNDIHQNNTRKDENGNDVPANYNLYGNTTENLPIFKLSDNGVLTVNQDLIDDPSLLAASEYPINDGKEDAGLIDKFIALKDKQAFSNYTASDFLQSIVSEIAVDVKKAQTFEKNHANIQKSIENQKMSVSGVDGDEESMNLVKYQEAFELSSKMISVMQEIYNKLINEMGV